MKTVKKPQRKESDADKALAKAGSDDRKKNRVEKQDEAFSESIKAEKDEVKDAEERLRQANKK